MVTQYEEKLGTFQGKTHLLFWEARPDMNNPREFVVNISYRDFTEWKPKRVEIVRIDNVGKPLHMDQLWKKGNPKKELDWKGDKWELLYRSYRELKEDWRKYARRWTRNEA